MSQAITVDGESIKNHGWRVTFAGMGINLALGVLYSWSIISGGMDARLTVISGPDAAAERSVAVGAEAVTLGREMKTKGLSLTDKTVSPKHAVVAYDRANKTYTIAAAEGGGAVVVDGKPITGAVPLKEGAKVKLGETVLDFKDGWGWTQSEKSLPYALACLVFCLIMVPAGRMQDKLSPRMVATLGGILVGAGMIMASLLGNSHAGWIVGFGVLASAGIGFGYASATPPAVKWFSKAKTGLIAGLVVSGFGLASVYIAPLGNALIGSYGLETTAMAFGIGFLVIVVGLAQLLKAPPAGYVPPGQPPADPAAATKKEDFLPSEMLKTWQFYILWFMYACGAGAGLMVISVAKKLGKSAGGNAGVIAVTTLAIGNGAGRIIAGVLSDKIGRKATMCIFFVIQAVMVVLLAIAAKGEALSGTAALALIAAFVGMNYGSNLSLFPSTTKDYYGLKNFGMNYGLVFTAWGVGGYLLAQFAAKVYDGKIVESWKGSFDFAFYTSAALLIVAAVMTFVVKAPHHEVPAGPADGA